MKVLIVENIKELGLLWQRALQRLGAEVVFVQTQSAAIRCLMDQSYDIIVLDLVLESGSAFAISDFANYKRPEARVFFVTNTSFFQMAPFFSTVRMPVATSKVQPRLKILQRWLNIMPTDAVPFQTSIRLAPSFVRESAYPIGLEQRARGPNLSSVTNLP